MPITQDSQLISFAMYIGCGRQFKVYDHGDHVEKIPTSVYDVKRLLLKSDATYFFRPRQLDAEARRIIGEREKSLNILRNREYDAHLLAGLQFAGEVILQDKVPVLGDVLRSSKDAHNIVDKYIAAIRRGWEAGCHEMSFNFTVNNGMNEDGDVVITDIGELTFDKTVVLRQIESKFWKSSWTAGRLKKDICEYYFQRMDELVTRQELDRLWRDALILNRADVA